MSSSYSHVRGDWYGEAFVLQVRDGCKWVSVLYQSTCFTKVKVKDPEKFDKLNQFISFFLTLWRFGIHDLIHLSSSLVMYEGSRNKGSRSLHHIIDFKKNFQYKKPKFNTNTRNFLLRSQILNVFFKLKNRNNFIENIFFFYFSSI